MNQTEMERYDLEFCSDDCTADVVPVENGEYVLAVDAAERVEALKEVLRSLGHWQFTEIPTVRRYCWCPTIIGWTEHTPECVAAGKLVNDEPTI